MVYYPNSQSHASAHPFFEDVKHQHNSQPMKFIGSTKPHFHPYFTQSFGIHWVDKWGVSCNMAACHPFYRTILPWILMMAPWNADKNGVEMLRITFAPVSQYGKETRRACWEIYRTGNCINGGKIELLKINWDCCRSQCGKWLDSMYYQLWLFQHICVCFH